MVLDKHLSQLFLLSMGKMSLGLYGVVDELHFLLCRTGLPDL